MEQDFPPIIQSDPVIAN